MCSTGNSLEVLPSEMEVFTATEAVCKDMEGASLAWAASLLSLPLLAVKVVTDIVDGDKPTHEEFMANLGTAAASLKQAVPAVLDFIAGKELSEL